MVYTHKTKPNASKVMSQVLKFAGQVDSRMDEKICRITVSAYTIKDNIDPAFQEKYKNDHLCQIEIVDIPEKEFLVFEGLLEYLEEIVVIDQQ